MSKSSKSRGVSMALAAMATVLTIGAATVHAANNGLSAKQVRAIVKQEVAKVRRGLTGTVGPAGVQGMPGPQGPRGTDGVDGMSILFAYIDIDGNVDAGRSVGITQENLQVDTRYFEGAASPDPEGNIVASTTYCFIGLPPIMGGQVTMDGDAGYAAVVSPKLWLNTPDGCPVRVAIHGYEQFPSDHREPPIAEPFYVLLY